MNVLSRAWTCVRLALVASLASAAAVAQPRRLQAPEQEPLVRCIPCQNQGRVPCKAHPKEELTFEDHVMYCSLLADCATCGGTGWLDCSDCENPKWPAVLERKRANIAAVQKAAVAKYSSEMKRPLRLVTSEHFVLVWEIDELKVDKRNVAHHELMHLYARRMEQLFADYSTALQLGAREFRERALVMVWANSADQEQASGRFAGQSSPRGTKLMGSTPVYTTCGSKQFAKDDETLHRNLVHNVTHLLFSHQNPSQWIGNLKGGWIDEGLAHWFEERYFGVCDNYCYEEQNTQVGFKGGKWKPVVRKLVAAGDVPSLVDVTQRNTDALEPLMHALAFSYVDYLLATDGGKFNALGKSLRQKVALRDALQKSFGMALLDFEERWKAWVLSTYPTR